MSADGYGSALIASAWSHQINMWAPNTCEITCVRPRSNHASHKHALRLSATHSRSPPTDSSILEYRWLDRLLRRVGRAQTQTPSIADDHGNDDFTRDTPPPHPRLLEEAGRRGSAHVNALMTTPARLGLWEVVNGRGAAPRGALPSLHN